MAKLTLPATIEAVNISLAPPGAPVPVGEPGHSGWWQLPRGGHLAGVHTSPSERLAC